VIITLSCTLLSNTILFLSPILSCLVYLHCFCHRILTKRYHRKYFRNLDKHIYGLKWPKIGPKTQNQQEFKKPPYLISTLSSNVKAKDYPNETFLIECNPLTWKSIYFVVEISVNRYFLSLSSKLMTFSFISSNQGLKNKIIKWSFGPFFKKLKRSKIYYLKSTRTNFNFLHQFETITYFPRLFHLDSLSFNLAIC
jgi:hypothetical protein